MSKRFALLYSDGSIGIIAEGTPIEKVTEDRVFADEGETDPARMTRIALVDFSIAEIIFDPTTAEKTHGHCSSCGHPLGSGA